MIDRISATIDVTIAIIEQKNIVAILDPLSVKLCNLQSFFDVFLPFIEGFYFTNEVVIASVHLGIRLPLLIEVDPAE